MAKRQDDWRDPDWNIAFAPAVHFRGTSGDDDLVGGNGRDKFHIAQGGNDTISGKKGKDTVYVGATLTGEDRFNGGADTDRLVLEGDYSGGLTLQTDTIARFEFVDLVGGFDYSITMAPDMRHDSDVIDVDATQAQSLYLDGSAMDFLFGVRGSSGDDVIIGGSGQNSFNAGAGHDVMTGGAFIDSYGFFSTADSLPSNPDIITNFDSALDILFLASIDADPKKPGDQAFHLGATPNHVGDITLTYDAGQDATFVNLFTNKDAVPDMVIQLSGDHTDLTTANFVF